MVLDTLIYAIKMIALIANWCFVKDLKWFLPVFGAFHQRSSPLESEDVIIEHCFIALK